MRPGRVLAIALAGGGVALASVSQAVPAPRAGHVDPVTVVRGAVAYHGISLSRQPTQRPYNIRIRYAGAQPAYRVVYTGWQAGEPTIGVDRHGRPYVAAGDWHHIGKTTLDQWPTISTQFGSANTQERTTKFLTSADDGRSWQVDQAPLVAGRGDGHPWFFDPYLYVDKDSGRVFEGTLTDAGGSYFDFTDDAGRSWTRASMYVPGINDHETVFAGRVPTGSGLTVTDKHFGKVAYYCVNQLLDAACARSLDGGRTFRPTGGIGYQPTTEDRSHGISTCEGLTGHGQADPDGRIFLPWPCNGPWIGISADAGATWQQVRVDPGSDIGTSPRAGTTSVAVDAAGNLYYVWWDDVYFLPYLAISHDHGRTWSQPRMIAPPGVGEVNFTAIDVGGPGRIAVNFVGTTDPDQTHPDRPWNHYTVLSLNALSANPTFLATVTNPGGADDPIHRGMCQGACAGMLDYLDEPVVAPDLEGTVWAAAVDTCTATNGCAAPSGTGAEATDQQGVVIRQVSGPWLR
jgi:hypothetical protein